MELSEYESVLNEIGGVYVQLRKECLVGCANLLDTHEVTLAEKNCLQNCIKKHYYANSHFQKLTAQNLSKVNSLNDKFLNTQYKP
jgi:hypothetical protein